MKQFDWAVVGSGITGTVISEILTREGHSAVLIEKNDKLASETTRDFHEWIHTGSLYTLIPDNLMTLKFILGAIDDLLEFYSCYERMNLVPTERGLTFSETKNQWFEDNHIHFKFRVQGRKLIFPWLMGVARAIFLIERIKEHDWLRQRAGIIDPFKLKYKIILQKTLELLKHKESFFDIETPDFTTNSRNLLRDLITTSMNNGLLISEKNTFINFERNNDQIIVNCQKESFSCGNLVLCIGSGVSKFIDSTVKESYAPLAVIGNIKKGFNSFVELDYYPKNCINILTKNDQVGLIGGISFSNIEKCEDYINQVIEKHRKYNPELEVLHKYIGVKSEITIKNQPRNYLYHILQIEKNIWTVIPGKFTLGFSIAPEFYRRVYKKNPKKVVMTAIENSTSTEKVSNTVWFDVKTNNIKKEK
jgi:hypothetical protein